MGPLAGPSGVGRADPVEPWEHEHEAAVRDGRAGYLDPATGSWVFTAEALRARGTCCGSGCRHCPFGTDGAEGGGRSR